jgi:AraC-like DNA-binding protein/CheY-like chemotaxis protein
MNTRNRGVVVFAEADRHPFYRAFAVGGEPTEIRDFRGAFDWVPGGKADLAIIECGFRIHQALGLLRAIKRASPATVVIIITEAGSEGDAIESFNAGARQYLKMPVDIFRLRELVKALLKLKRETREKRSLLVEGEKTPEVGAVKITSREPANLLRAIKYIEENLEDAIDLETCAREGSLSKFQFCRVFKQHFGISPMRYVSLLRVNRAKVLLQRDDLNITEVSSKAGFKSGASFLKAFKRSTGLSPREYRNSSKLA